MQSPRQSRWKPPSPTRTRACTIFLQDDTGVTFIRGAKDNPKVARGERLRIEGETHNGLIIGGIKPAHIEHLSIGPPVEPREVTAGDLASGRYHYHWVTIAGVGRSLRSEDENRATLRLNHRGKDDRTALR